MMTPRQPHKTLVPAATLAGHLGDPDWVVVDTRFRLGAPGAGQEAYGSGHIPGARYADLDRDLAASPSPGSGRHPLPPKAAWARRVGAMGIDARSQVVCYDDAGGTIAARLWWMLRWAGHDRVAVLDGGWQAWVGGGYPTETGTTMPQRRPFAPLYDDRLIAATDEILARLDDPDWCLLDARAPERFRGEVEPIDKVAGHVPGAVNAPCGDNLDAAGRFRSAAELEARYRALLGGLPPDATVVMCGSGVTACHDILAMTLAGLAGARLYVGSWSAWSADAARPVAPLR